MPVQSQQIHHQSQPAVTKMLNFHSFVRQTQACISSAWLGKLLTLHAGIHMLHVMWLCITVIVTDQ